MSSAEVNDILPPALCEAAQPALAVLDSKIALQMQQYKFLMNWDLKLRIAEAHAITPS